MAKNLKGKTIVITGGARGIGFSIAEKFLDKDVKIVILLDIDNKRGEASAEILNLKYGNNKAVFFKCDVTKDLDEITEKILQKYQIIDVLVNNAGVPGGLSIKEVMNVNAIAVMEWSEKFFQHMRTDKGGKGGTIINMSSVYGFRINPFGPYYTSSKYAVLGFTRSYGHEYHFRRHGVRVVAICPGFTETEIFNNLQLSDDPHYQKDVEKFVKNVVWQKVEVVGSAAVDIFEKADSGTAWIIEESKPIEEVPY